MYDGNEEEKDIANAAWEAAIKRRAQEIAEDPESTAWNNIRGPASALIATMESIGWQMSAPHTRQ